MTTVDLTVPGLRASFDSGKGILHVYVPGAGTCAVLGWPIPLARRRTRRSDRWVRCRPILSVRSGPIDLRIAHLGVETDENQQLLMPFAVAPKDRRDRASEIAWLRWSATIPARERDFVSRYSSRQWELLEFLAGNGSPALDLATASPALTFALATRWTYRRAPAQQPLRVTHSLLGKKQRELLGGVGVPLATESARKIFAKIPHESVTAQTLRTVSRGMLDPRILHAMRHLPRLNTGALSALVRAELLLYVTPSLLDEISLCREEDRRPQAANVLKDITRMVRTIGPLHSRPRPVRSLADLRIFHDELVEVLNTLRGWMNSPFPSPPVEGTDRIVPIASAIELVREGRVQKSCLGAYVEKVIRERDIYFYRVTAAERCTLALLKYEDWWVPGEFRSASNKDPSETSVKAVEEWIAGAARGRVLWARLTEEEDLPF